MKIKSHRTLVLTRPSENDIRDYAYHLYQLDGCAPGHDQEHWDDAAAYLNRNISTDHSGLHHGQPIPAPAGGEWKTATTALVA